MVLRITPGDTELKECAFLMQSCIHTVILPASIEHIRTQAFQGCSGLAEVWFAEGSRLKTIGSQAFYGCVRLQHVSIPAGTADIGNSAFADCSRIVGLVLPAGCTTGGQGGDEYDYTLGAFNGCSSLARVLAPDDLVRGEAADPAWVFEGCPVLAGAGLTPHSAVPLLRRTLWHPTMHAWCRADQHACVLAVLVAELRSDRQDEKTAPLPFMDHDLWLLILQFVPRHQLGRP